MGILFNRKDKKSGAVLNKKYISDKELSDKSADLRQISKDLGFFRVRNVRKAAKWLYTAQKSGKRLTKDEVHTHLQDMVRNGDLREVHAKKIAKNAGFDLSLPRNDFRSRTELSRGASTSTKRYGKRMKSKLY